MSKMTESKKVQISGTAYLSMETSMASNLPPGVTNSMIPGNRSEDEDRTDLHEYVNEVLQTAIFSIIARGALLRNATHQDPLEEYEGFLTDIGNTIDEGLVELRKIRAFFEAEPDPDSNPHEMETPDD